MGINYQPQLVSRISYSNSIRGLGLYLYILRSRCQSSGSSRSMQVEPIPEHAVPHIASWVKNLWPPENNRKIDRPTRGNLSLEEQLEASFVLGSFYGGSGTSNLCGDTFHLPPDKILMFPPRHWQKSSMFMPMPPFYRDFFRPVMWSSWNFQRKKHMPSWTAVPRSCFRQCRTPAKTSLGSNVTTIHKGIPICHEFIGRLRVPVMGIRSHWSQWCCKEFSQTFDFDLLFCTL